MTEAEIKELAIKSLLERDIHACDMKWSLFVAACQHYRVDTCLKPFPPDYIVNGWKDVQSLLDQLNSIPTLSHLFNSLHSKDGKVSTKLIDLAYWVLIGTKEFELETITKDEFDNILKLVPCEKRAQRPSQIFRVTMPRLVKKNQDVWKNQGKFAYHGSQLENFHSILYYGLQQHMNKNSLFGQGVYLSSELSMSLLFSPSSIAWKGSIISDQLSCVVLCEMANHPDVMTGEDKRRVTASDSIGGEVPNKYYVVRNSDLVRVRYLLVYSSKHQPQQRAMQSRWTILRWLQRNKLVTLIVVYIAMLTAIGLSNNNQAQRFYKTILSKMKLH